MEGDSRQRYVCSGCGTTHYQNPTVLVATYVCVGEKFLWIRRGIAPKVGKWAIPGGYMENEETPEGAACRELREETGIVLAPEDLMLVSVSSILHMTQTHLVFRCHLDSYPRTIETVEALECAWFSEKELPWDDIAFKSIEPQIRQMYRWLRKGNFGIRIGFVDQSGSQYRNFPLAIQSES
jgi:ADP-ribose pyrophosphatase YjhB (NUDIX family)